jgi:hypothetical protein
MEPKHTSKENFLNALSKWKKCYMKKPKSWQKVWLWWEKSKYDPKEQWFMNVAMSTKKGKDTKEDSVWFTADNINAWLDYMERQGYNYYTNE